MPIGVNLSPNSFKILVSSLRLKMHLVVALPPVREAEPPNTILLG
ncbi:hypothetical protein GXM_04137 [Nostoc sphaeroides CCNUC1]|uniref:Uncharacterized protein n=1 Tax=Nostoc sphaeroides CCNUC1 TaxID=2653204 RepID=A0A5P8W302_9NOSO|nr:hypothetical protein GXM_04137 [Nostoc sphaeroides CCNUC1]